MVSIIVCSVNHQLFKKLKINIELTIGIEYELIRFDNHEKSLGICEVYNHCAERAKYPYLLFIHEDIMFHSHEWGLRLVNTLKKDNIGLLGVAGAIFKASSPMSWVATPSEYYRSNAFFEKSENIKSYSVDSKVVVVVDGMLIAIRKGIWEQFRFNSELKGFHLYDIDLSYRIFKAGYDLVVAGNIQVQHFSKGTFNTCWFKESTKWHSGKELPIFLPSVSKPEISYLELYSKINYLQYLLDHGRNAKKWVFIYLQVLLKSRRPHSKLLFKIINHYSKKFRLIIKNRFYELTKFILNSILRLRVRNRDFAIISNNCWGGAIYKALGIPYNTPFVGLYINSPCYMKLIQNLDFLLRKELVFTQESKYPIQKISYPIGLLDDVEIHFLHYSSEEEAKTKWERRLKRLLKSDRLYYKIDDRDFSSKDDINDFHKCFESNTISFTKKKYDFSRNIELSNPDDLILLHTTFHLFDLAHFLNKGVVKNSTFNKIQNHFFKYPPTWN